MRVFKLQNFSYGRNNSFGSNLSLDIGGSQKEGSCKIYYAASSDNREIYTKNTLVNDIGKMKFVDEDDFKDRIVRKIDTLQRLSKPTIAKMGYPDSENTIRSLTIFIPSYTSGTLAYYLPNYRDKNDRPLNGMDFGDLKERLLASGVDVDSDMKFVLLQDAFGAGLTVAQKLYNQGMLSKGKSYTVGITGGGCGVVNIEMTDDEKVTLKSSNSGYFAEKSRLGKVSKEGASAPVVIKNFCKIFNVGEKLTEDIVSCRKAEFVLNNPFTLEKNAKTEKLRDLLLETGKYNLDDDNDEQITMSVKDEYSDLYTMSQRYAIDRYCLAFARLAIIKKTEASNGLIVTGPLAQAVDKVGKEKFSMGIGDWVEYHLKKSFDSEELDIMQDNYDFHVLCDERFFLQNNTECRELSHKVSFVDPKRGNWIQIKADDLKE